MEHLQIATGNKADKYALLLRQIDAFFQDEPDMIARMANVSAMLHETFHFWWTGFYRVQGDELVLGPFQGRSKYAPLQKTPRNLHVLFTSYSSLRQLLRLSKNA